MKKAITRVAVGAVLSIAALTGAATIQANAACQPAFSFTDTQGRTWNFGCKVKAPAPTVTTFAYSFTAK